MWFCVCPMLSTDVKVLALAIYFVDMEAEAWSCSLVRVVMCSFLSSLLLLHFSVKYTILYILNIM